MSERTGGPRVAVLTLHYGANPGAILQAEAMARLYGGEIFDHRYRSREQLYAHGLAQKPHLAEYIARDLPLSRVKSVTEDFDNKPAWRAIERHYDLLVCGSDELLKVNYRWPRRLRTLLRSLRRKPLATLFNYADIQSCWDYYIPFPNVYWSRARLPTVMCAASIGSTDPRTIPRRHRRDMATCLEKCRLIGVRDTRTLEFVESLSQNLKGRAELVPDPVFAYEPSESARNSAHAKLDSVRRGPGPLGFVYMAKQKHLVGEWSNRLRDAGYEPIDLSAVNLTPPEWFAAIGRFGCGVTDRMHALVISLAQNVPCHSIDSRFKSAELRSRFGVPAHVDLREFVRDWPTSVPDRVAEQRCRVRDFVKKALAQARGAVEPVHVA